MCSVFGAEGIPQWYNIEATLPPDIPDTARDAVRKGFFDQQLWPALIKQGAHPTQYSSTQNAFFKETERQDKSENPKLRLAGAAALRTLVSPGGAVAQLVNGPDAANKYVDSLNKMTQAVRRDANKQGIETNGLFTQGGLSETVGAMAGGAPAFAFVLFVIVAVVRGVASRNGNRVPEDADAEKKVVAVPKPAPARPSRLTKENMKNFALVACVFVLYCLLFFKYLNDGVPDLVGAIAATALTVFLYKQIARKAKLD